MALGLQRKYKKGFDVGRKWYHSASSVLYSTPSTGWHVGKVFMGLHYSCCSQMVDCFAPTEISYMAFFFVIYIVYEGRVKYFSEMWVIFCHLPFPRERSGIL